MLEQPDIRPVMESGEVYRLYQDYVFYLDGLAFNIKEGFKLDGGSVPRWAWSISGLTPDGMARAAFLIHDYMYYKKGQMISVSGQLYYYDKKKSDKEFKANLNRLSIKSVSIFIYYNAVKWFGGKAWRN